MVVSSYHLQPNSSIHQINQYQSRLETASSTRSYVLLPYNPIFRVQSPHFTVKAWYITTFPQINARLEGMHTFLMVNVLPLFDVGKQ